MKLQGDVGQTRIAREVIYEFDGSWWLEDLTAANPSLNVTTAIDESTGDTIVYWEPRDTP